jgi:lipopolysaccharide transport system permease protein
MFIENANIIKKIKFPRISLLVVVVICALIDFIIIFGIFTVFLILTGNFPGLVYFAAIPLVSILVLLAAGLGIFTGVLNVFFKDTEKIVEITLQFWFWMTPIIYPINVIPTNYKSYIQFNPITAIIQELQSIFISKQLPNFNTLYPVMLITLIICICGLSLYKKTLGELVDEL